MPEITNQQNAVISRANKLASEISGNKKLLEEIFALKTNEGLSHDEIAKKLTPKLSPYISVVRTAIGKVFPLHFEDRDFIERNRKRLLKETREKKTPKRYKEQGYKERGKLSASAQGKNIRTEEMFDYLKEISDSYRLYTGRLDLRSLYKEFSEKYPGTVFGSLQIYAGRLGLAGKRETRTPQYDNLLSENMIDLATNPSSKYRVYQGKVKVNNPLIEEEFKKNFHNEEEAQRKTPKAIRKRLEHIRNILGINLNELPSNK